MTFGESDLAALAAAKEIKIETRSAAGTVHRTIIWVAEHDGAIYIRSVNGPGARWYREATAPDAGPIAVHVAGRRVPVRLERADGPGVDRGLQRGPPREVPPLVLPRRACSWTTSSPTTLRVEPA